MNKKWEEKFKKIFQSELSKRLDKLFPSRGKERDRATLLYLRACVLSRILLEEQKEEIVKALTDNYKQCKRTALSDITKIIKEL